MSIFTYCGPSSLGHQHSVCIDLIYMYIYFPQFVSFLVSLIYLVAFFVYL